MTSPFSKGGWRGISPTVTGYRPPTPGTRQESRIPPTIIRSPMSAIEEKIARELQAAADAGELKIARDFGKPFEDDISWMETPAALRMPFKVLKDAGLAPPEAGMFHERSALKDAIAACTDDAQRIALQKKLSDLDQKIALRMDSLRTHASL